MGNGHMGQRAYGATGIWGHGYMGQRAYGATSIWGNEYMGNGHMGNGHMGPWVCRAMKWVYGAMGGRPMRLLHILIA